jgi:isocitrate/isopropylmalate dehydrogenase
MAKNILVLPGDGVGPEVTSSAVSVLAAAAGSDITITYGEIGLSAFEQTGQHLPAETVDLATEADAIIAGTVIDNTGDRRYHNPIRTLKKQLNLYAVIRKFFPLCDRIGIGGIDMMVMCGNPDSLLNISETESIDGVMSQKFMSVNSCKKLFAKTVQVADSKNRKKITCVHRASLFPDSDGLFLDLFYKETTAAGFVIDDMEVEVAASEMIMNPSSLDVLVSTDIYGTVLGGLGAGMVGGGYLTPVGSLGDSIGLFEPMHGPRLEMATKGNVNPTSAILSGAMALDYVGMTEKSENIRKAVRTVYANGDVTPDVGGTMKTDDFTAAIIEVLNYNE